MHKPSIKNQGDFANMYCPLLENVARNKWAIFLVETGCILRAQGEFQHASSRRTRRNCVVAHKEDSPISEVATKTPRLVSVSSTLSTPKDIEHNGEFAVLINVFLALGCFFVLFVLIFSSAVFDEHYQSIM